jgi:hypothetical protein
MMFSNFITTYHPAAVTREATRALPPSGLSVSGYTDFMSRYAGLSVAGGLYRIHELEKIEEWNEIVSEYFPDFRGRVSCFAFDWLGRQFALDRQRLVEDEPAVLMFEPGTGEVFEIPATFATFHDDEIVKYHNEVLASALFESWSALHTTPLAHTECAGYKVPLFLGGKENVENLELIDMEVYWVVVGQLLNKTREMPPGTKIGNISIS